MDHARYRIDVAADASPQDDTPRAMRVANAFVRLKLRPRARILGRLLASVGSLALAVVCGGAFAKYITQARWPEIRVSLDDAARATVVQVFELLRYVEQSNPRLFERLADELARRCAADGLRPA
jgi:hypothetical protein